MITKRLTTIEKGIGMDESVLSIEFEVPNEQFDLETALECAVSDFAESDEGKKLIKESGTGTFGLMDVDMYLPNSFCEAHGFRKLETLFIDDVLISDRNFLTEY